MIMETTNGNAGRQEMLPTYMDMKKETIGKTYKHLNQLLNGKSDKSFINLEELIEPAKPLPLFEESLRLILVDRLHLGNIVLKIILDQNEYQIKRICRCKWYFQKSVFAEYYITEVFPKLSAFVKNKIINQLGKHLSDERAAEQFVEFIRLNYCCEKAEYLLPRCSSTFIRNYNDKHKPLFQYDTSVRVLLNISKRFPDVAILILFSVFEMNNSKLYKFSCVLKYLAGNNSDAFLPFYEKFQLKLSFLRFGKKLSRKFGSKLTKFLSSTLQSTFNQEALFRVCSFEKKVNFLATLIQKEAKKSTYQHWNNSKYTISFLLKTVKPDDRLCIIESTFKQVFNLNLRDHPYLFKPELLELLPLNVRRPFVDSYINFCKNDQSENDDSRECFEGEQSETIVYLYDFETAFKKLRQMLAKCPNVSDRQNVLSYMIRNCGINNDQKGLQTILEYVASRHRNDEPRLVVDFIKEVFDYFKADKLSFDSIQKIEEMANLCLVKIPNYYSETLVEKVILYKLEKNFDSSALIKNFISLVILRRTYTHALLQNYRSKYSRKLFFEYYNEIFRCLRTGTIESNVLKVLPMSILETLYRLNKCQKKNPIRLNEFPELVSELRKHENKYLKLGSGHMINLWQTYSSKAFEPWFKAKFLRYALKKEPETIVGDVESVINDLISECDKPCEEFFVLSKKTLSFFEKIVKVKQIILEKLKEEDSFTRKSNAIKLYSHIANISEFEEAVEKYIPKSEKIDLTLDPDFAAIQLFIPKVMKNLKSGPQNFPLIFKFFFGDFLRDVVPAFYSACYRTPMQNLTVVLTTHLHNVDHRISLRKHAIRLLAELSSRNEQLDICLKSWEAEKHYSIRTILFKRVSDLFVECPGEKSFKILEKFILESDELVIESRPDILRVPDPYLDKYVSDLWKFSERMEPRVRNDFRNSILSSLKLEKIRHLSYDFCRNIITNNLFKSSPLKVNEFTVFFIISDMRTMHSKLLMVLELFHSSNNPNSVSCFFQSVKLIFLRHNSSFGDIFDVLLSNWPEYSAEVFYEDRLTLMYYNSYDKVLKKSEFVKEEEKSYFISSELGKELKKLLKNLKNLTELMIIVSESLEQFFNEVKQYNKDFNIFLTIRELVEDVSEKDLLILAILLVPEDAVRVYKQDDQSFDIDYNNSLNEIIEILKRNPDETVQIYFRRKLGFKKGELDGSTVSRK